MRSAIDAVLNGALDPAPLFTHQFPLSELNAALEVSRNRSDNVMKALVLA